MRALTRRQLCAGSVLAGAVWGLGCDGGPAADRSQAGFAGLVGTDFAVGRGADRGQTLRLAAVHARRAPRAGGESFLLEFEAADVMTRAQGTRSLQHPALGAFDLFLVPLRGRGSSGRARFAATCCRL